MSEEFAFGVGTLMSYHGHECTYRGVGEATLAANLRLCSNGLIGECHNILMAALEATLLADEDSISYQRLVDAVDAWCMADGTIDRNFLKLDGAQGS